MKHLTGEGATAPDPLACPADAGSLRESKGMARGAGVVGSAPAARPAVVDRLDPHAGFTRLVAKQGTQRGESRVALRPSKRGRSRLPTGGAAYWITRSLRAG
jgi:hypothetical protein